MIPAGSKVQQTPIAAINGVALKDAGEAEVTSPRKTVDNEAHQFSVQLFNRAELNINWKKVPRGCRPSRVLIVSMDYNYKYRERGRMSNVR